jgi:multidrug efflux pump subunit AcrA (membrane-fusion protein)
MCIRDSFQAFAPDGQAGATARLRVPASAIFAARAGEGFVWRIDRKGNDSIVTPAPVELGPVSGDWVTVTSGLSPGERIVARGVDRLVEGMAVTTPSAARAAFAPGASSGN